MRKGLIRYFIIVMLTAFCAQGAGAFTMIREGVEIGHVTEFINDYCDDRSPKYYYFRTQFKGDTIIGDYKYAICYVYETPVLDTSIPNCRLFVTEVDGKYYSFSASDGFTQSALHKYFNRNLLYGAIYTCVDNNDEITINNGWDSDYELYRFKKGASIELLNGELRDYYIISEAKFSLFGDAILIDGIGCITEKLTPYGTLVAPYFDQPTNGTSSVRAVLYERDLSTGELVYKSPVFEKYAYGDPTIGGDGIGTVSNDAATISVSGRSVTTEGSALTAYSLDGRVVAQGVGSLTLPAAGAYIVRSASGATRKVMVQ